jgi:predicted DsbA family dithiol-disulfide isomerase
MRTALRLQEYFEYSYERLATKVEADRQAKEASKQLDKLPNDEMLMSNLDDKFTASDAYTIGELQGITRRTVSNILNRMLENGRVIKTSRANYEKATERH